MKRMLFNGTHSEELRVAIVDGQKLIDIDIEAAGRESRKSNIYKGVITRVEPSLEACFVNYGEERHGFLPFKEISKAYFKPGVDASRGRMQDALSEGMELLVQIDKEERGTKGAALTTYVSLAGRYLVLMPNNPRGGGVSRRVEGEDRQELRETMDKLDVPAGMSLIARTAGIGRTAEELQWDLNYLLQLWRAIDDASRTMAGAFLIYQESSLVIRAIRDYFTADIGELLIDTDDIYEQARQFMGHVMPDNVDRVKRYRDDTPLFSRFQIEHQIETAHSRLVPLPSGGAIVIDHTEALVSIDVNSARATRGSDIEETALRTNLEAADEVARQMRLRDLGGLIVIDFIDMESAKNQREVEQRLKDALHYDRARVQTGKISRFGLMELSRQRLRPALAEGSHVGCPRCNGTGFIRDTESAALHVIRVLQEEAMKDNSAAVYAQVPVEVATFLLNEKRAEIAKMEARLKVDVVLIPNKHLETPHYKIERIKHDDERLGSYRPTYTLADGPQESEDTYLARKLEPAKPRQEAVVKSVTPAQPAPVAARPEPTPTPVAAEPARRSGAQSSAGRAAGGAPSAAPGTSADGLFGRILGFFRRKAANEASASPDAVTPPTAAPAAEPARAAGEPRGRGRGDGAGRGGREDQRRRGEGRSGEGRANGNRAEPRMARASADGAAASVGRSDDGSGEQRVDASESRGGRGARGERAGRGERGRGEPRTERPARQSAGDRGEPRQAPDPEAVGTGAAAAVAAGMATGSMTESSAPAEASGIVVQPPLGAPMRPVVDDAPGQAVAPEAIDDAIAAAEAIEQPAGDEETGDGDVARRRRRRRRGGRRDRADGQVDAADAPGATPTGDADAVDETGDAGSMTAVAEAAMDAEAAAGAIVESPPAGEANPPGLVGGSLDRETSEDSSTSDAALTVAAAPAPTTEPLAHAAVSPQAPATGDRPDPAESSAGSIGPAVSEAATADETRSVAADGTRAAEAAVATDAVESGSGGRPADKPAMAPPPPSDDIRQAGVVGPAASPAIVPQIPAPDTAAPTAVPDLATLRSAVSAVGLELVETRVRTDEPDEPVAAAPRAPRARRRRETPAAEPLQQVETGRGDTP